MALYEIRDTGGRDNRGLGAFATRDIAAGETILCEAPILVYPQASLSSQFCSHCLRDVGALGEYSSTLKNHVFVDDLNGPRS